MNTYDELETMLHDMVPAERERLLHRLERHQQELEDCGCGSKTGGDYAAEAAGYGVGPAGAPIDDAPAESISLATIAVTNGSMIEFAAIREEGDRFGIAIREMGDASRPARPTFAHHPLMSPIEIFRKLSPKGPVPKHLANSDGSQKRSFDLVDTLDEPIEADLDELQLQPSPLAATDSGGGWGAQYCVPGDGWHAFKNHFCDNASFPSNTWWWCDPSVAYGWRDRWTVGHKRKNSLGITATCGAPASTQHYYQNAFGNWKHQKTWHLPNNFWQWTRYCGLSKRDRWIRHRSAISGPPSFVRSVTFIYT
jgi:hypothetical protein